MEIIKWQAEEIKPNEHSIVCANTTDFSALFILSQVEP